MANDQVNIYLPAFYYTMKFTEGLLTSALQLKFLLLILKQLVNKYILVPRLV